MTAVVRSLPGVVDHDSTPTGPIPVHQIVDTEAGDYDVRLDLSGHIDLIALAKAIRSDEGAMFEWYVLMHNTRFGQLRCLMAQADLRSIPAVRAALTVKLTPEDAGLSAGSLAECLEEASVEPARCQYTGRDCRAFADDGTELCSEHLAHLADEDRCEVDCDEPVDGDTSYEPFSGKHMCPTHIAEAQGD